MSTEDTDHVFRICNVSCGIWEDICKGITKSNSYKIEWSEWMWDNLKCNTLLLDRIPGYLLFAIVLWFIWKWRCEKIFNQSFQLPICPGKVILQFVNEWLDANFTLENAAVKNN